jgi:hypothetical protein
VVGYRPFSLCILIHKEGLCPSSGDINGLIQMKFKILTNNYFPIAAFDELLWKDQQHLGPVPTLPTFVHNS